MKISTIFIRFVYISCLCTILGPKGSNDAWKRRSCPSREDAPRNSSGNFFREIIFSRKTPLCRFHEIFNFFLYFQQMLSTVLNIIMFEDCRNQVRITKWSHFTNFSTISRIFFPFFLVVNVPTFTWSCPTQWRLFRKSPWSGK